LTNQNPNNPFSLPFALLIGPQRAGTTWIDRYLRARGDICLPEEVKEIFFFDRHYKRGIKFYRSHFHPHKNHKLAIEITTTSFDCAEAPERIHHIFGPDIKLICPLRHPIIRSYSLYLHYKRYGLVQGSLQKAALQVPQIIDSSRYSKHLENWFKIFDRDNIKIIYQEELEQSQNNFVKQLCDSLSIHFVQAAKEDSSPYNITTVSKFGKLALIIQKLADFLRKNRLYFIINIAKSIGLKKIIFGKEKIEIAQHKIPQEDWNWLQENLGDEIKKYEKLLGHPIEHWRNIEKDYIHD
jgi:hypothetical protein